MTPQSERRYNAELRKGGETVGAHRDVGIDALVKAHPAPAWGLAAERIASLLPGQHTRIELSANGALILERI
jgi:hypothetical protein